MPIEEETAQLKAAIVVARNLASTFFAAEEATLQRLSDRARYCQLLGVKARLPARTTHTLVLAAWVAGLGGREGMAGDLFEKHGLDAIATPSAGPPQEETAEARIFSLVMAFEKARLVEPDRAVDLARLRPRLQREWACSPERELTLRRFMTVLRNEAALTEEKTAAGRILIVDPAEEVTPVLAPVLARHGYAVDVAPHAEAAEELLATHTPDSVIVDMELPVVGGVEFCRHLKSRPETAPCHVILLTKKRSRATEKAALRAGADDVLRKPVDLEWLVLRMNRLTAAGPAGGRAGSSGASGNLAEMAFTDLVQILTAGGKSAGILLNNNDARGEVLVKDGEVIHASVAGLEGEPAFHLLMRWRQGTFSTTPLPARAPHTIHRGVMGLLMEGARTLDEGERPAADDTAASRANVDR